MKFLLIGFFGRTYMPYMEEYERILKEEGAAYDVTCFERYTTEPVKMRPLENGVEYTYSHVTTASAASKLLPALRYFHFVRGLIRKNKYDRLIVFTTMPAVFLSGTLLRSYDKRYIYDYRDYTYEKYTAFAHAALRVMEHACFACFSSKGYLIYYPKFENYLITHNISNMDYKNVCAEDLRQKKHICIGFLGYVRYFDINRRLIDSFAGREKYKLKYVGSAFSDCDLPTYCRERNIKNVEFYGTYQNSEKPALYQDIDIINSIYSLESPEVKQAIPNRIYDAALYKKPILVAKGTYLSEIVEQYGLGLTIDPQEDNIAVVVEEYLREFDSKEFQNRCDRFLNIVEQDIDLFQQKVRMFVRGGTDERRIR